MRILHFTYLFSIIYLLPLILRAQEFWTLTHFNSENGLPQNSVTFAGIDHDGYLWLTTQSGIVRYDGQRFRVFDRNNSSLLRNRFEMLGTDSKGNIYCFDEYFKISFYNNQTGFSKPVAGLGRVPASDGGLVDISKWDIGELARYTGKVIQNVSSDFFSGFRYHPVDHERGFIVRDAGVGYVLNKKVHWVQSSVLPLSNYYTGNIYTVGTVGDQLCFITKSLDAILIDSNGVHRRTKLPFPFPRARSLPNVPPVRLFRQDQQTLLNMDGDIYQVELAGNALTYHRLISVKNISFISCIRYYPDRGLLIIGSATEGLYLFRKRQMVSVVKNSYAEPSYGLAPYRDERPFSTIGTLQGTLPPSGVVESFSKGTVLRDHKGHYWYSEKNVLYETDEEMHNLRKVPLSSWPAGLKEDEQGDIWLSVWTTQFGRVEGNTFQPYKLEGVTGKNIQSFIPLGNQTFWLVGTGLCLWVDVKNRKQHIYHEFDNIELRSVYRDKRGNIWLGSYGQGYFLFHNERFTKMPEDEAHHLKIVHCFLEDSKGFVWMTTNSGLLQCKIDDLYDYAAGKTPGVYHHYYGKESGMKTTEFNGGCNPCGLRLANGRFAFPSMNGVVLFNPDSIKPELPSENIFIEQVMLDGKLTDKEALLQISPSFKRLEMSVLSPYFGHPGNLNIYYNIEGLDERWYPLAENARIVLNTIKYGRYKLRLRKDAGFGKNNYITAELSFVVMPFFYQTWWFYLLIMACVVGIVMVVIKMRYRYLVRQRNRLEAEVKDRTRALAYQNKLMEKLTVMIAHDLKSPLYFLSKVTGNLRHNVQRENLQEVDRASSEIKNTADHVYRFVEEFNLWASSFTEGFTVNKTSFALDGLLQELGLFFKEMAESNGNRMVFPASGQFILNTDRELLKVILRNVIDNANKHTQSGEIAILLNTEVDGQVAITIADTGEGMTEPVLKRIHDRITQASTAAGIERNSRLGYQMIIDFAARLDARLEVWSERGKGTSVTLRIQGRVSGANLSQDLAEQAVSAG